MPPSSPPRDRPGLEVADIFRGESASFLKTYGRSLSTQQKRAITAIQACRTAILGGHVRTCDHCAHHEISYNSCRNRHCPKCQAMAGAEWLKQREAELLPIPYFHVVFTLPEEIARLALQNKRLLYGMLFEAASQTLRQVAANPRHLGADEIGLLAVLHTWGQNLQHHPHLHCVVSGGGLAAGGDRWIAAKPHYFLPVKVLSRVFRNKYRALLQKAFRRGQLGFFGALAPLADPRAFDRWLDAATKREWVVYAKRPFREAACVLKYLARYTHRVAISNGRLVAYRDGQVTFRYKDYARAGRQRTMTLAATEFMRRFLLHVLPDGFMRIRHYGYLANRHRQHKLATCRQLLGCATPAFNSPVAAPPAPSPESEQSHRESDEHDAADVTIRCPVCQSGRMRVTEIIERLSSRANSRSPWERLSRIPPQDSS
jgi:Putative transposase/Transposase zinc-binding domain